MGNREIFASRLREIRQQTGKTQKEFADMIMSTAATISAYENSTKNPSLDIVMNIAEKCNVSVDWLCGLSERQVKSGTFETYGDILTTFFELDNNTKILLSKQKISDYYTMTGIFFDDDVLDGFLEEWLDATNVKDNTAINKSITQAMYDSWKKTKLEELKNKKLKKNKRKKV